MIETGTMHKGSAHSTTDFTGGAAVLVELPSPICEENVKDKEARFAAAKRGYVHRADGMRSF